MAARGTGFPPRSTMGFWDKEHRMRRLRFVYRWFTMSALNTHLTCTGTVMHVWRTRIQSTFWLSLVPVRHWGAMMMIC